MPLATTSDSLIATIRYTARTFTRLVRKSTVRISAFALHISTGHEALLQTTNVLSACHSAASETVRRHAITRRNDDCCCMRSSCHPKTDDGECLIQIVFLIHVISFHFTPLLASGLYLRQHGIDEDELVRQRQNASGRHHHLLPTCLHPIRI